MKSYKLFAWAEFYPNGGYEDFVKSFDSIESAAKYVEDTYPSQQGYQITWCHIVFEDKIIIKGTLPYKYLNQPDPLWEWELYK